MHDSLDALEPRLCLSGNMTATVTNGDLVISGGASSTAITIDADQLESGQLRLTPEHFSTINGQSEPIVLSGVSGEVLINLRRGRDDVRVEGVTFAGSLTVLGGRGVDNIVVADSRVRGSLKIGAGPGIGIVSVLNSVVDGSAIIKTGTDADIVIVDGSTFNSSTRIDGGPGSYDNYYIRDVRFPGERAGGFARLIHDTGRAKNLFDRPQHIDFDFDSGANDWRAGFADYPIGQEDSFDLASGIQRMPAGLGGNGFFISGNNHSDDLFMYLKRRLGPEDGIRPRQIYLVTYDILFASNAPSGCAGIGGSPGESVFLKAGASQGEPKGIAGHDNMVIMNIRKGNQGEGGSNAKVVGTIANGIDCDHASQDASGPPSRMVHRRSSEMIEVSADRKGFLWLLVGTDSGYEGTTQLYYKQINVSLLPLPYW